MSTHKFELQTLLISFYAFESNLFEKVDHMTKKLQTWINSCFLFVSCFKIIWGASQKKTLGCY
jgi:hypothetical protein